MADQPETETNGVQRILVVEDDPDTRSMLTMRLQREGYIVFAAHSGAEALELLRREGLPSLVLLDIMLPDMDGFAVAAEIRSVGAAPIIFLSALSDTDRKVEGISRYAEDYITKPFTFNELLARMRRVLARTLGDITADPEMAIDERLKVNFAQHYALVDGNQVTLTPTETRLLQVLVNHRGRVLSAGFLLAKAWEPAQNGTLESLWVHIRRLRNKIESDPDTPRYIKTVRGQGYCLPQRVRAPS